MSRGFSLRKIFWITGVLAFCLSPVADNLTTALVMGAVVMAVGGSNPSFVIVSCVSIVVAANAAYVAWGVAILRSGFPADWVGWVAIVTGVLIALWASLTDDWFQHLTLITPIALAIALLLY